MSRDVKTWETFDIVLTLQDDNDPDDIVRQATGLHPGCQNIPFEDVEFLKKNIFDKIASDHGYIVDVVRKIHVWCRNCSGYIGYVKLPFELHRFDRYNRCDPDTRLGMYSRSLRCYGCNSNTGISIRDLTSIH